MNHYSSSDYPFSKSIGHYLNRADLLKNHLLDHYLAPLDISAAQCRVLIYIGYEKANTPAELCRELSIDSGSMTRMLDRLENKGLLVRSPCPQDRRRVRLALSAEGQLICEQTPQLIANAMNDLASGLSHDELVCLNGLLEKMLLPHQTVAAGE
ncbi:MarR family transcriptional regulator [Pseudomonas sp. LS44]|uniref:MarR family winged helix-turn-helix transcriptional regulator n=1 Tax=Pseudomonas sp. LS44 TaxID=1357074 RepID=UPI00215A785E|nr:MarR family transcriptional regulator [Pseudomonas sp. LS44]UVE16104.1 MarR family transcriptional regulator [Pseudomonas sp. LS44]